MKQALKVDDARSTEEELADWKRELGRMREQGTRRELRIVELDYEKSKLELKVAALVRLLIESGVVDSGRLAEMMEVIDAEDGRVDGRVTPDDPRRTPFVAGD